MQRVEPMITCVFVTREPPLSSERCHGVAAAFSSTLFGMRVISGHHKQSVAAAKTKTIWSIMPSAQDRPT